MFRLLFEKLDNDKKISVVFLQSFRERSSAGPGASPALVLCEELPISQINRPLALSAWHLVSALSKGSSSLVFLSFDRV